LTTMPTTARTHKHNLASQQTTTHANKHPTPHPAHARPLHVDTRRRLAYSRRLDGL